MAERAELPSPASFETLVAWRRDVRRFKTGPIDAELFAHLLDVANLAPSVGNSQPWRIVQVESPDRRQAVRANFEAANAAAAKRYDEARGAQYCNLKLAGFDRAPVHLAVFCDPDPVRGHGLGRQTMAEALDYSCVGYITILWLLARTHGVGLGWVSILETAELNRLLDVPADWRFIGYILMGYPEEEHEDPELVRHGWQARGNIADRLFLR
ncbi:MAG: 5,6-dimethylbenzimidazole synthase [Hyphomicrobiaceae bacterium]